MIRGVNYIAGVASAEGEIEFSTFDPKKNTETGWRFREATEREIDRAVASASAAFLQYRDTPASDKAKFLRAIADEIEALGEVLLDSYVAESGLPQGRAVGERGRTMAQLRAFADMVEEGSWVEAVIDTAIPDRQPMPKDDIRKMLFPIGPVAVFGASNFPLAFSTAGGDTASALAAGCPVVVKGHPMHAGTGELVASAITLAASKTRMPKGVFSHLNSSGTEVGKRLVLHPGIKAVGFTGSQQGGMALYRLAMERKEPIPVFAEMGSINPVVILPSAIAGDATKWARAYAGSITLGTGQFCTNPGLILGISGEPLARFMDELAKALSEMDASCMLHPRIHDGFVRGRDRAVDQPGSDRLIDYSGETSPNFVGPTVIKVDGKDFLNNPVLHKEVFGPFSVVVACEDAKMLASVVQQLEGQLTGTVLGSEAELTEYPEIVATLADRVGRVIFNGVPTGVEVCAAMQHGGPFPAATDSRFTSVGTSAIRRWVRPIAYQNWPEKALRPELRNDNPLGILRLVDNRYSRSKI